MFIAELRFPNLTVEIPEISDIGRLLNNHLNSIGESPDVTKHETLAESPWLDGSSPKLKLAIFGGTRNNFEKKKIINRSPNLRSNFYLRKSQKLRLTKM